MLTRSDLFTLETYAEQRAQFRARVLTHKKTRQVALGPNATLYFEDRLTIQYQIQEMLRIERIFEAQAIEEELAAYNPLIPDGNNWKATFMIEFPDATERRTALENLYGIEDRLWVAVQGYERVLGVADEDLERKTDDKTSAVHFVRFELEQPMINALKGGGALTMGVDLDQYRYETSPIETATRQALIADLQ